MVGSVGQTHLYDMESYYGTFSVMPVYTQSFRPERIARCFFGNDLTSGNSCDTSCDGKTIKIQGSKVTDRDPKAWLADYFYLAPDFKGSFEICPRIRNFLLDFDLYVGLDEWACGLYFRAYGPFTHTRWDLNFCETVDAAGTDSYVRGYFAANDVLNSSLLENFGSYASGNSASHSGTTFNGLKFGKMDRCVRTDNGFADLRFELGWNFWQCEDYHLGFNIQAAAPTGGKKRACYLFDALVGNGNHWELGGGLTGHYVFWRCDDESKHFGFYFDANITHLFKAKQERTFDLCGKPNSRYMLAQKLGKPVEAGLGGGDGDVPVASPGTPANFQFKNEFAPVANISTLEVDVKVNVQADIVAMFNYTSCGFSWDFGYNFWGRGCEDIDCPDSCDSKCITSSVCDNSQQNTWALKGDSRVYGFEYGNNTAHGLSATQSKATIHKGTNRGDNPDSPDTDNCYERNFGVDNAKFAFVTATRLKFASDANNVDDNNQVKTSIQPIFINCKTGDNRLDFDGSRTRGISHKIFTHFSYTWDRECWVPYVGFGGFAEFGHDDSKSSSSCNTSSSNSSSSSCNTGCNTSCDTKCSSCHDCAVSQWGVWLKAGVSFN